MWIITIIMFILRVLQLWLASANLQVTPCVISTTNPMKIFCKENMTSCEPYYRTFCQEAHGCNEEVDTLPHCHSIKTASPLGFLVISRELSQCPLEWTDITCTNVKRSVLSWKQTVILSSHLWCIYQTWWNIVLNWAPVASISQDKRVFRFPVTLVPYHARAPANILFLLPTYVRVLFNSCSWNRSSAFPGCNPLSLQERCPQSPYCLLMCPL